MSYFYFAPSCQSRHGQHLPPWRAQRVMRVQYRYHLVPNQNRGHRLLICINVQIWSTEPDILPRKTFSRSFRLHHLGSDLTRRRVSTYDTGHSSAFAAVCRKTTCVAFVFWLIRSNRTSRLPSMQGLYISSLMLQFTATRRKIPAFRPGRPST